jgi:hypothetical protein
MKLYTEEQVKESFYNGVKYASGIHPASIGWINQYVEGIINSLTPIELPSDEEIEKIAQWVIDNRYAKSELNKVSDFEMYHHIIKWMKEQILGKEDKTFKQKSKWTEVDNMTKRLK